MRLVMVGAFIVFIVTGLAHYPQVYFFEVLILILLLTAIIGYCPLYALFGINTLAPENKAEEEIGNTK